MSVVVSSGLYRRGAGRLFCALLAGREKCKPLLSRMTGNVFRGLEGSQLMRLPRLMMMGFRCFRVSGVAGIMIVSMWRMLSDMRRGK